MTDTVTPTLKPCPFCGAAGTMRKDDDPSYPFYATFDHERSCPMYAVPTDLFLSGAIPTDVERLWNQRAAEAAQAAEIARLRELVASAYAEGWGDAVLGIVSEGPDAWNGSDARADLSAQPGEQGAGS